MADSPEVVLLKLEAHERECTVRYQMIERRLEEGSHRVRRIEAILWGLYGLVVALGSYSEFIR
jgi:hypothetical protein